MPTDNERREVARRLRGLEPCLFDDGEYIDCGEVEEAIGLVNDDGAWYRADGVMRLADLIEPHEPYCIANVTIDGEELERMANKAVKEAIGIDRDALLELAYFMDRDAVKFMDAAPHEFNPCTLAKAWAREIRKALGVES